MPGHSMDMDMSASGSTDYSDYEYQTVVAETAVDGEDVDGDGDAEMRVIDGYEFDPLGAVGGLDSNEVAELVYFELQPSLEPEPADTETQQTNTDLEYRGLFGANLPTGATIGGGTQPRLTNRLEAERVEEREVGGRGPRGLETTDDRIFQPFLTRGVYPFQNSGEGTAAASINDGNIYSKAYRDLLGRGPVLDSNDTITVNTQMNAGDLIGALTATTRIHMIWDTAEVDDAGRAFSVPE